MFVASPFEPVSEHYGVRNSRSELKGPLPWGMPGTTTYNSESMSEPSIYVSVVLGQ